MNLLFSLLCALLIASCGPVPETAKTPPSLVETKEMVYVRGHELYLLQHFDSATVVLRRAESMDPSYREPVADLAALYYDVGTRAPEKSAQRLENFRRALAYYTKLDSLGAKDADLYERLSEICYALDKKELYVRYAKKNRDAYPFDRQYMNLMIAYFGAGEYTRAIEVGKEATAKFKASPYIGSYYRQLGRAYMKIDRDQTAERTFEAGLKTVDERLAHLRKAGGEYKMSDEYRRLIDDKVGMLISLKGLHQVYGAFEKLERAERELKEATK